MSRTDRVRELGGPGLALARFVESDFNAVHEFASDPLVCEHTTWGPNTAEDTQAFIAEATTPVTDGFLLAVMRGEEAIGSAAVWTTSSSDRSGELGFTIRRDCWGHGYGTEVATLLLQLGFQRLGLERLAATCAPNNAGSVRVLEKAGPRQESLLRGHVLVRGRRRDSIVFGRLAPIGDRQRAGWPTATRVSPEVEHTQ